MGEGVVLLLRIVIILLWAYVAWRVYVDAERRGLPALPWAIFVLLTGVIVLLIYYLIARNYPIRGERMAAGGAAGPIGSGHHPSIWEGPKSSRAAEIAPDADFSDEYLDQLIREGRLREARSYLNDMLQMAREMNDPKGMVNYRKYERRIADSGLRGIR